jgi:MYXO-CTERM domain-containing protein
MTNGQGPITWTLSRSGGLALPAGMSFDAATGAVAWTPSSLDVGALSLVFDASTGAVQDTKLLNLTVTCGLASQLLLGCGCAAAESSGLWMLAALALARASRRGRRLGLTRARPTPDRPEGRSARTRCG